MAGLNSLLNKQPSFFNQLQLNSGATAVTLSVTGGTNTPTVLFTATRLPGSKLVSFSVSSPSTTLNWGGSPGYASVSLSSLPASLQPINNQQQIYTSSGASPSGTPSGMCLVIQGSLGAGIGPLNSANSLGVFTSNASGNNWYQFNGSYYAAN